MKRAFVIFLVALLFCSAMPSFAEEDWLKPYDEPVTVRFGRCSDVPNFPEGENLGSNGYTQWLKEQFNLQFEGEWVLSDRTDYSTRITLAMSSNSLVDVFEVVDLIQLRQLIDGGMVADLTEAIESDSSDLLKAIIESDGGMDVYFGPNVRGSDGAIYAFPCNAPGYEFTLIWIRQDWLDALGLETPTTWAALEETAQAFVDNKMAGDQTVGIEMMNTLEDTYCSAGSPGPVFWRYGAYPNNWIVDEETGDFVYGSVQPEMKQALAYLHELYGKGLIDPEFATKNWTESLIAGRSGIVFGAWWIGAWPLNSVKTNDPNAQWVPTLIYDDNGTYNAVAPSVETESMYWVVRKGFEHPDVLVKMANIAAEQQNLFGIEEFDLYEKHIPHEVDTYYSNVGYKMDYHVWPIDMKLRMYDQLIHLEKVWTKLVEDVQNGMEIPTFATESFDGKLIVDYMNGVDQSGQGLHVYTKTLALQLLAANRDRISTRQLYTAPITPTMEMAWTNLSDMESQTFVRIVMGELPVDAFDEFVSNWYAQGGSMIDDEVNAIMK